jgi:hypothetical protein
MWKCWLWSVRQHGTQHVHTLQYSSSDGQLKVQEINLELWFVGIPNSVPPVMLCSLASLMWWAVWRFSSSHHLLACCTHYTITINLCQLAVNFGGGKYVLHIETKFFAWPCFQRRILGIASDGLTLVPSVALLHYCSCYLLLICIMLDWHKSYRIGNLAYWTSLV